MSRVRENQNAESPVRTRPLSGISVGRTTSKVEMRSLATSRSLSGSSSKSSRTFPLATCIAVSSGMDGLLLLVGGELLQSLEQHVDVTKGEVEIEGIRESPGVEPARDLGVRLDEATEVHLLVPGPERVSLDDSIRLVSSQAGLDEREQNALGEDQSVGGLEIASHANGVDDEAVDEPRKPVEHVVECENASGRTTRSALEWEMSRSCQSATFSSPTAAAARTTLARPQIRSATMGLRLCGIADEPFWPRPNGSCTSRSSVRARCLISVANRSSDAAQSASDERRAA